MADMRNTNGYPEIRENRDVDLDGKKISEIAAYLREKAKGLKDAHLVVEADSYYDSVYIIQHITGWRKATPAEIHHREQEVEMRATASRRRAEMDLERIRHEHPDLLS